jgi:hypothetical protein
MVLFADVQGFVSLIDVATGKVVKSVNGTANGKSVVCDFMAARANLAICADMKANENLITFDVGKFAFDSKSVRKLGGNFPFNTAVRQGLGSNTYIGLFSWANDKQVTVISWVWGSSKLTNLTTVPQNPAGDTFAAFLAADPRSGYTDAYIVDINKMQTLVYVRKANFKTGIYGSPVLAQNCPISGWDGIFTPTPLFVPRTNELLFYSSGHGFRGINVGTGVTNGYGNFSCTQGDHGFVYATGAGVDPVTNQAYFVVRGAVPKAEYTCLIQVDLASKVFAHKVIQVTGVPPFKPNSVAPVFGVAALLTGRGQ